MPSETQLPAPEGQKGPLAGVSPLEIILTDDLSDIEVSTLSPKDLSLARSEVLDFEVEHERQKKRVELKGLRQDIKARKRYARNIFTLIVCWLIAIFIILILQGFSALSFKLSDGVLIALIGGTTANVLGLFIFVVQYLFPKRNPDKSS
jgi:hypothetical protein